MPRAGNVTSQRRPTWCTRFFDVDRSPGSGLTSSPDPPTGARPTDGLWVPPVVGSPAPVGPVRRVLWAPRDLPALGPDVAHDLTRYREWSCRREEERVAAGRRRPGGSGGPELALLLVLRQPVPAALGRCLQSVAGQTSTRWSLSVACIGTPEPEVKATLDEALAPFPQGRAEVQWCGEEASDAEAAAAALTATSTPAFMLLGQHDRLAADAVALLAAALDDADVAYADDDEVDDGGSPRDPRLKPDWSPELCLSLPYVGHPVAYRRQPATAAGGIRALAGGDWEHDLLLRTTECTSRVAHVPEVLCHRQASPVLSPQGADGVGGDGAVTSALARRGIDASVSPGPVGGSRAVHRRVRGRPRVTTVIPFRDAAPLLRACVDSVTETTAEDGVDLELVLVDNGSTEPETFTLLDRLEARPGVVVRRDPRPFNWAALNNAAADAVRGDVLLFLNNDIEALRPGWLAALAVQALRPDVGAVGARLLYPGGRVQHAGVVLGLGGAAGHVLAGLPGDQPGYLGMAVLTRDCSAVTGACLATRREVFESLGGFDEDLGLDVNDIDYCLRARERGLAAIYEPLAELVHHESPSRGTSGSPKDQLRFLERWQDVVVSGDPYLNRNLTRADCSAALRRGDEEKDWQEWRSTLTRS